VAASGGYYISAGADRIIAEPMTITGSIGVIAQAFTARQLLNKIGIQPETITATQATRKDVMDWTRDWTDADRQMLRKFLDYGYERFLEVVYQGRQQHLTREQVRAIGTGEPFTTEQAMEHHLIDQEGYLDDAVDAAKKLAGMASASRPRVTVVTRPAGLFGSLMGGSGVHLSLAEWKDPDRVRRLLVELSQPRLEYRLDWGR